MEGRRPDPAGARGSFTYTYLGPTFGVVQNMVETRRRATAPQRSCCCFLNIIALGGGPVFTGWLIDAFAQFHFTHPGAGGILQSLGGLLGESGTVRFAHSSPGGAAPAGAWPAPAASYKATLVTATRQESK